MTNPRVWLVLFAVGAVLAFVVADTMRTSPGPMAAVHAGITSCADCHGGWFGTMTQACLECHEPIGRQIEGAAGLHGVLGRARAEACGSCHSDHHGAEFQLVNRRSFAQADVPDPLRFDHARIGFRMDGKHLEQECSKCHENADLAVLPAGATRFTGLAKDCATCHKDPHEGRMQVACANCHGQIAFDRFEALEHHDLPLVGGHAEVGCRDCHAKDGLNSLELVGERRRSIVRDCADCHMSPHREGFVHGSCAECHLETHTSFTSELLQLSPEQHAASGFVLAKPHEEVACGKCHAGEKFVARYPGRAQDRCDQCHPDPHRGQFRQGCVECHASTHFAPHTFTVAHHEQTSLPLTGRHVETECNECHTVPAEGLARRFRDTPNTCANCHADAHRGFFEPDSVCAKCHGTQSFRTDAEQPFDHAARAGFAIVGAHRQDGCESCHARSPEPDEHGRTFGRVEERFGKFTGCATCHANPHGRDFAGQPGCAECHNQTSFRTVAEEFDHGRWTGFALADKHAAAACSACHTRRRKPDEAGRTWERAKGGRCMDCHADPHAAQFAVEGVTDCARCHDAKSFVETRFFHERDSRFRLGKQHEKVACAACHKTVRWNDRDVVRYRPLGRRCSDCHAAQKNLFHREKR